MKKTILKTAISAVLAVVLLLSIVSCAPENDDNGKINIVATTTMLHDLVNQLGGDMVNSVGLMGVGIDPHSYAASAGDIATMNDADIVIYNGYDLEGEMGEIFASLDTQGKDVICVEDGLSEDKLLLDPTSEAEVFDPHVWFEVSLWIEVAAHVAGELEKFDPDNAEVYSTNLESYTKELEELDEYVKGRVSEVPEEQRVLITAHDAFGYFGHAYGFEVMGLQGISTDTEASTSDISEFANFIADNEIKAIFVESSVSSKNIEALQDAVAALDFEVSIGGELYSDSLGGADKGHDTYIDTVKANVDTIVDALK